MKMKRHLKPVISAMVAACLYIASPAAMAADERESLEQLRTTTLSLIELLVQEGVLSKSKADALIREAEAARQAAAEKDAAVKAESAIDENAQAAESGVKAVRVQYVPEHVKNEMREEIKKDVMAKLNYKASERLGLPTWIDRIQWEGDLRLRYERDLFPEGNETPINLDLQGTNITNTTEDRERWRVRARLGAKLNINDNVKGGIRIVTGGINDPVSPNQTLGNTGSKYSFSLDRAYLTYQMLDWFSFAGGQITNPWVSSDLVWDSDMSFDGFAANLKPRLSENLKGFATAGAFAIQEVEGSDTVIAKGKWLYGAQTGLVWESSSRTSLMLGLGYYDFKNVQGVANDFGFRNNDKTAPQFRQKGNTLYDINSANAGTLLGREILGLASQFRLVNFNASLDVEAFSPVHVVLVGDYVKNVGFNMDEVAGKNPINTIGGNIGWMAKLQIGMPQTLKRHDWNVHGIYKHLETNAVLDAFTDSDFRLGGTNAKGWIVGGNYGLDKNTWLSLRWLSADEIETSPGFLPLSIDVLQLDLNAKF